MSSKILPNVRSCLVTEKEIKDLIERDNPWEGTLEAKGISKIHVARASKGYVEMWANDLDMNRSSVITLNYSNFSDKKSREEKRKYKSQVDHAKNLPESSTITLSISNTLVDMWKKLSYLTPENEIVGTWYAVIYTVNKSKHHLYIGRVMKRFLAEENGKAIQFEINCLKPHSGSKNILEAYSDDFEDVHVFPTYDIINGPITAIDLTEGKFEVQGYQNMVKLFNRIKNMDRKGLLEKTA